LPLLKFQPSYIDVQSQMAVVLQVTVTMNIIGTIALTVKLIHEN